MRIKKSSGEAVRARNKGSLLPEPLTELDTDLHIQIKNIQLFAFTSSQARVYVNNKDDA